MSRTATAPSFRFAWLCSLGIAAALASGCAVSERDLGDMASLPNADDAIGSASLALTSAPAGAQCLSVTTSTTGSSATQSFALTAGAATSGLSLGRLPLGTVSFAALAYDQACSAIATQTPTWVGDPVSARIETGATARVTIALRRNNPAEASATFIDNFASLWPSMAGVVAVTEEGASFVWGQIPAMSVSGLLGPVAVPSSTLSNVAALRGALNNTCTLDNLGVARCMGSNTYGQLGTGIVGGAFTYAPGEVLSSNVGSIAVAEQATCLVTTSGTLRCTGRNYYGQLGINSTADSASLVTVNPSPATVLYSRVYAGQSHFCGITRGGLVYCWGRNNFGQLGVGDTTQRNVPTFISSEIAVVELALSAGTTCARRVDGSVRCWGYNYYGNVGDGTTVDKSAPALVSLPRARQISAFNVGGGAWCWGSNSTGAVGDGTRENRFRATPVKL